MLTQIKELSSYTSPYLITNMGGVKFKQFQRTYPGNLSINFTTCLSGINDFKTKNFTNFYLTNNWRISNVFDNDETPSKTSNIFGTISFGGNYLKFKTINSEAYALFNRYQEHYYYGLGKFVTDKSSADRFTITISDNNKCNIFYTLDYIKYYLCVDSSNDLVFIREDVVPNVANTINPQDFVYQFSENSTEFLFFKKTENDSYALTKVGDNLKLKLVKKNNTETYINSTFQVNSNIYNNPNINLNTSFISYNSDNTIDVDKSVFDLSNNLLIHRKYSDLTNTSDIIILKNQLLQNDVFSSANTLLSSTEATIFVEGLREYTTIGQQINDVSSDSLELNYVFYNMPYKIPTGTTIFKSPSSMYPFTKLNINDTKFISSGAFAFTTPEYSDKVYKISSDVKNSDNGQYLLCTWLSGSPFGSDKVWIDRYYYPDLISKADAIMGLNYARCTYNDYIENMIIENTSLSNNVSVQKFFDKKSDLVFEPNTDYMYSRIEYTAFPSLSSKFTYCSDYSNIYPTNYFKNINKSGEISIGFNFRGDDLSWTVKSERNLIDSGITFTKTGNVLDILFNVYDYTSYELNNSSNSWYTESVSVEIKSLKNNFVSISVDSKTGIGYIFFNDVIVSNFTIPVYQLYIKQLIYGDFYIYSGSDKINLLDTKFTSITNVFINDYYIEPELVFLYSLSETNPIDTIYVTLPCGMRNSTDDVEFIHGICSSSTFKSNNINISIKNLNIENETILSDVKDYIMSTISNIIPPNIQVKNIKFDNYK